MGEILQHAGARPPIAMTWEELLSACARDKENSFLWAEFLRRYGPGIRGFVHGILRQMAGACFASNLADILGGLQSSDLFQNVIMRLVENDCALIKRFSGNSEGGWLAYLAVLTRSVVRDSVRRQRAFRRPGRAMVFAPEPPGEVQFRQPAGAHEMDRKVLAHEVMELGERAIQGVAGETASRDLLIFQLHFDHDLSFDQIARCRNVNLSKTGVEKALTRMKAIVREAVSEESSEEMIQ